MNWQKGLRYLPISRFDQQLVATQFKINTLIILFFMIVYCIVDFLEKNTRYFPKYNASTRHIVEYYLVQTPKIVSDLLPFSCLFASIATFWIYAKSNEITAMRASGCSLKRIMLPCILFGLCVSVANFFLAETLVPKTLMQFKIVETVKIEKQSLDGVLFEGNWIRGKNAHMKFESPSLLSPVQPNERKSSRISKVEYFQFSPQNSEITSLIRANEAYYDEQKKIWVLVKGVETQFTNQNNRKIGKNTHFLERETEIRSQPPKLVREGVGSDHLSYWTLRNLLQKSTGGSVLSREVDLYQKLTSPLACFFFVFFALPFCLRQERQADTYVGIVWCLVAAIVYWIGNFSLRSLAQNGVIAPQIAAAVVPLLLAIPCGWLYFRLDHQK
jgi:lipopolysaccharide export system permease protein